MFQKRRLIQLAMLISMAYATALFVGCATPPKAEVLKPDIKTKTALFLTANKSWQAAKHANAKILAPQNFSAGENAYIQAEKAFNQEKALEEIRFALRASDDYFQKALKAVKLAQVTFPNTIKARQNALLSESAIMSPDIWAQAETKFNNATGLLEDGKMVEAKTKADEADKLYRKAELAAIQARYLTEAKNIIKQADQKDIQTYAPKTLASAKSLIAQAEKELNENPYDNDVARSLARQAKYQVTHAIYLGMTIKALKEKNRSIEDLMLASEVPLQRIIEQTGRVASFEAGYNQPTKDVILYIQSFQDSVARLSQDINWYHDQHILFVARIAELVGMLDDQEKMKSSMASKIALQGGLLGRQERQHSDLAAEIASQNKIQERYTNVNKLFTRSEARVLREGDDVIIRLVGLDFPSDIATIEQKSFGLLTKVQDAINSFAGSTVTVTGYTDSYGSDEENLTLSIARAEAVKQYILANTNLDASSVEAIGYGESQPIATNETELGRAANRRVEVVIHP
ncbi:MAG: OmpA family protein [Candidatus Marinimicrobia bacterium]|nr:OmpA family protein [Candidatus Neomarinimicrobiota bacterium]